MSNILQNSPKTAENIQIMSAEDEKIRLIGSLLCNDSSRHILRLLLENEMSLGEIAQRTEMPLSLVTYHIQKMERAGLIRIINTKKNSKGHDVKYYGPTNLVVIIFPQKASDKAKNSKSFLGSLKRIYRFSAIGFASMISAFITQNIQYEPAHSGAAYSVWQTDIMATFVPGLVLFGGLIIENILSRIRR